MKYFRFFIFRKYEEEKSIEFDLRSHFWHQTAFIPQLTFPALLTENFLSFLAGEEDNWNEDDEKSSAKSNLDEAPKSAASEPEVGSPSSPSNTSPKIETLQAVIKIEPDTECPAAADPVEVCESVIKKAGSVNDLDTISGATSPGATAATVTKTTSPPIIKTEPLASPVPSVPTPNEQDQYVGIQPPALQSGNCEFFCFTTFL